MKNQLAYDRQVKKQVEYFRSKMQMNPKAIAFLSGAVTEENIDAFSEMDEDAIYNFIGENEVASEFMGNLFLANDVKGMMKEDKEPLSTYHDRRKVAIEKLYYQCKKENQKRITKLEEIGKSCNIPELTKKLQKPNAEKEKEVDERTIREMLNGQYPATLLVNQIFSAVIEAENKIALFSVLLPVEEVLK